MLDCIGQECQEQGLCRIQMGNSGLPGCGGGGAWAELLCLLPGQTLGVGCASLLSCSCRAFASASSLESGWGAGGACSNMPRLRMICRSPGLLYKQLTQNCVAYLGCVQNTGKQKKTSLGNNCILPAVQGATIPRNELCFTDRVSGSHKLHKR